MESKYNITYVIDVLIKIFENTFTKEPDANMISTILNKELQSVEEIPFLQIIEQKEVQDTETFTEKLKKELKYTLKKCEKELMLQTEINLLLYFVLLIFKEGITTNRLPSLTIKGMMTILLESIIYYFNYKSDLYYKCSFTISEFCDLKFENLPQFFKVNIQKIIFRIQRIKLN